MDKGSLLGRTTTFDFLFKKNHFLALTSSYKDKLNKVPGVKTLQWDAYNLFYSMSKFEQKYAATLKVMITVQ